LQDYELSRDKTQYRIAFDGIDTDWDDLYDNVAFISANTQAVWARPQLFIIFKDDVNIGEGVIEDVDFSISNFPNPFNPSTTIKYELPVNVENPVIEIYNIKGQKVKSLVEEFSESSNHSVIWDGNDESGKPVSSGVYFYKLSVNDKSESVRKCLLLK
jgi:hypothetical protein